MEFISKQHVDTATNNPAIERVSGLFDKSSVDEMNCLFVASVSNFPKIFALQCQTSLNKTASALSQSSTKHKVAALISFVKQNKN